MKKQNNENGAMIKTTIEGSFSVQVFRDGKQILSLPRTKNLICRGGLAILQDFGGFLHVGTGGTTPVFADTSLENFLAASTSAGWSANTSVLNGSDYEKESQAIYSFAIGSVVGNIAELGVAQSSNETADTRALFKDGVGDPTTITLTAVDQLVITYFVKKISSMTPTVGSISATVAGSPVTIDFTIRPCIASSGDGGSSASFPASIYQTIGSTNLFMFVNDANRISVNPTTFIPTLIDGGGDTSPEGGASVALTATGSEVTHTMTFPIGTGNFQWVSATFSTSSSASVTTIFFQIEFDGPNFITKTSSDTVTFKLKEIMNQVIV